ncbi:sigma-54-dependent Fis family transcriptional regulator [Geobacter sp. FeAm09]|uniref:sigma-54-dependent Fis family transcriptional regulator n=1 Tax=Geobacter sp. FeAm09 TaxID=2597769 RepID=UPI0011EE065D|nr:sigma-54-dependent Fis family transcriptional regulator [Geobacter sp. FeAm09]QEM67693.1 sigma-54-dependent Fis family transcriptional regulator [Geobacter sp. FeAm09]
MKASELDLRQILSFSPKGGIMNFMGHRTLIIDAMAMGLLRKELIENLGAFSARNILTRLGYAHGWTTADNLDTEYSDLLQDPQCGPTLHMLQGAVNVAKCEIVFEPSFRMFNTWQQSYEAEQHLLHMGIAHEPVCWMLTGYVSGYCSRMLGEDIYCIESQCCAKGDPLCHNETRTREGWGSLIDPYLPYFQAETIGSMLHEVTAKLMKSEKQMKLKRSLMEDDYDCCGLTVKSKTMRNTLDLAKRIAKVESSVVITGESGVGKERIARIIHSESARALRPFVAINCSAVTETLLESEFFGHAKGSFTGANKDRFGLFEAASGGTLFLDEVGEISANMQAKLLRALQEREIRRVGENISRPVDVRIIAATNRDLSDEVAAGRFREDLYYRLCIFELLVPPLRDRQEDILLLARNFLNTATAKIGKEVIGFMPEVTDRLAQYNWPGNVRQLENTIEHAVVLCQGKRIELSDLPKSVRFKSSGNAHADMIRPMEEFEREQILSAIKLLDGDKTEAAKRLGISRSSLYQKIKRYEIT